MVPSTFIVAVVALGVLSIWLPLARLALAATAVLYGGAVALETFRMARRRSSPWARTAVAIAIIHWSYGVGLLAAVFGTLRGGSSRGALKHTRLSR